MPNYDDLFTGQPTQQDEKPFDKTVWAARKQAEREGVYAMIDSYVQDMGREGGLFQAYLDVQARFDLYSVSNAILIAAQCPEATKLADFDSWKANGVYVRRGADAITILEPGKEYQRDDGSVGVSYNVRKVFDISQTRAAQRPAPTTVRDERLLLKALMNDAPCRFAISNELPEGVNVAYHPQEHTVYVRQGLDAPTGHRRPPSAFSGPHGAPGTSCRSPAPPAPAPVPGRRPLPLPGSGLPGCPSPSRVSCRFLLRLRS